MSAMEGLAVDYRVYENRNAEHKAVGHTGTCGFCNHGHGAGRRMPR